jgi:O-antigen/teichoic acid export membrane protein
VFRDAAGFATSQYVLRFSNILRGFVVARLLGPAGNGLLQHYMILFEYGISLHAGILPGLNKHLGHRLGAGDEEEVHTAQRTGLGGMVLAGVLIWIGLCIWVATSWQTLHPVDRWGLPIIGFLVVMENITNTYRALLRARGRIGPISTLSVIFAVSNLTLALMLLPGLKIYGVLLAWLVTRVATTLWFIRTSGEGFSLGLDRRALWTLLVAGLPIFAFQTTRMMLRNIDRVLVDSVLNHEDLGIYGLAVTLVGLVRYGAEAVGFVMYPIFLRQFGESRDPTRLRENLESPTEFLALTVPVMLGFLFLTLHLPILWLLPKFEATIPVFRLLSASVVFSSLSVLPGFFMMAIDRQNWLIVIGVVTVAVTYFVGRMAIAAGYGLEGVAVVTSAALALDTTVVLAISGRFAFGSLRSAMAWIARSYAAGAYVAAVLIGIVWGTPHTPLAQWTEVGRSLTQGIFFLGVMAPAILVFERRTRFLQKLKRGRKGKASPPRGR